MFRGYSAKFQAATTAREVLDFTVQGPLFSCVAGLQDVVQMQELDIGGSIGTPPNIVPLPSEFLVAPAPQTVRGGRHPRGAVLLIRKETEGATVATIADIRRDEDWLFAILAAAIAAVAVNGGQALIDQLMYADSPGNIVATITRPIGTLTINKPFAAAPGLVGIDG